MRDRFQNADYSSMANLGSNVLGSAGIAPTPPGVWPQIYALQKRVAFLAETVQALSIRVLGSEEQANSVQTPATGGLLEGLQRLELDINSSSIALDRVLQAIGDR